MWQNEEWKGENIKCEKVGPPDITNQRLTHLFRHIISHIS